MSDNPHWIVLISVTSNTAFNNVTWYIIFSREHVQPIPPTSALLSPPPKILLASHFSFSFFCLELEKEFNKP
jgi:hypothetical protein